MLASPTSLKTFLFAAMAPAVAVAALAVVAPSASATLLSPYVPTGAECTLAASPTTNQGPALVDLLGYRFDTTSNKALLNAVLPAQYATLADGGGAALPPRRAVYDAYDDWGDLYVGATQSRATQYVDGDQLGCIREADGRQVAFATVEIGGLQVQRKLFSSASSGSGARLVQSVTNPGTSPVTTSVFVGDLTESTSRGDLGSDDGTTLELTSSGDQTITAGEDRWAVTSDGTKAGDPALAHVWDGPGGEAQASIVRSGAQDGVKTLAGTDDLDADRFGYGWQDVTIPAGGTASFLSWEAARAADALPEQIGMAQDAAVAISDAPAATIFEGLSAAEIAAVRNWAKPAPDVAIAPVASAASDADVVLSASTVDFSPGTALPQCEEGTLTWDFGDGTTAVGPGGSHRFAVGTAEVLVTARNACGGSAKATLSFEVSPPAPPVVITGDPSGSVPTPTPAPGVPTPGPSTDSAAPAVPSAPAAPGAPALTLIAPDQLPASLLGKKGVATEIASTVPGALRIVLSGGGLKLAKTMTLQPGAPRTPTFKLTARDLATARRAKKLQVRAKLTLDGGKEIITSRTITVRK